MCQLKTEYLLDRELDRVLAALTWENRLVCEVCLHTGLRISDALELKPADLKPNVWVTERKTGKRRQIGFDAELLEKLRDCCGEFWVFEGRIDPKKHRTRQAVWTDIKRAAKLFRMPQNIGPHSLRKVYATRLMQRYGSIERVQRALQHSSPSVTMLYAMADKLYSDRYKQLPDGRTVRRTERPGRDRGPSRGH